LNPATLKPFKLFFAGDKPRVIGHRGAAGEAPENTLFSFQRAVQDGSRFIELDVRGSRDGEVVAMHDATVGAAHELGVEMFVWTVNDREEMARLDGIITDFPGRLRDLVAERQA